MPRRNHNPRRQRPKDPKLAMKRHRKKRREIEIFVKVQKGRGQWNLP